MTLRSIVAALGGDLYQGGMRANVPAPGHSAADRSVSLMLFDGRVIVHAFGDGDWRSARDHLRNTGLIDAAGQLTGREGVGRLGADRAAPDRLERTRVAAAIWSGVSPLSGHCLASRHLRSRGVQTVSRSINLGLNPVVQRSVYGRGGGCCPALVARISDLDDCLTGVEVTYLEPGGQIARGLRVPRKTVGAVPSGSAVRLLAATEAMLVAEGVVTTLSAIARFQLPGWALLAAQNLASWSPPEGVRSVLIAADRGVAGEAAAWRLSDRLVASGLKVRLALPDLPHGDWNDVAVAEARERGK